MRNKKIAIIGLGLIGGSLAKAFKEKLNITEIYAVNRSRQSIDLALSEGYIKAGYQSLNDVIYSCDMIFICTSIKKTIEYIDVLKDKVSYDTLLTDVGSTKSEIVDYVNNIDKKLNFIGGHPMAGSEESGFSSSYSHLFENAYYILTPGEYAKDESIGELKTLVKNIGALPLMLDSINHDIITGSISHVPHIAASALVNLVRETDHDGLMKELAVGGFKDITRIASSNPEIWGTIIQSNKLEIKNILLNYIKILNNFVEYIDKDDTENIYNFFNTSKMFRDSFSNPNKNPLYPVLDITIDVIDKPGIIGKIATLLGSYNINIKNMTVSNSREYEEGCLKVTLSDYVSLNQSIELLTKEGYKVLYKSQKFNDK